MIEHEHDFEIHYTAVNWQEPIFVKCTEYDCGMTYRLVRYDRLRALFRAMESLANAAEDVGFTVYSEKDLEKLRNAWQVYVDVAPNEDARTDTDTPT